MTRVFFVTKARALNTDPAVEHGTPFILFERSPSPFKIDLCTKAMKIALDAAGFDPATDKIAVAGPNILVALLVTVASRYAEAIQLLLWDAPGERYVERTLSI